MEHLASFDEPLFELLKQQPNSLLPLFEDAVKTLAVQSNLLAEVPSHFQVMLLLHENVTPLRLLDVRVFHSLTLDWLLVQPRQGLWNRDLCRTVERKGHLSSRYV